MASSAIPYPFAEMRRRYESFSDCELVAALEDATAAWINQEAIEREFGPGRHAGKNAGWRADDFHTILDVMSKRRIRSLRNCDCGCGR